MSAISHSLFLIVAVIGISCPTVTDAQPSKRHHHIFLTEQLDSVALYMPFQYDGVTKVFHFNDPRDSVYVTLKLGRSEDMGAAWYNNYYVFNKNVEDGTYAIYVNDKLREKVSYKNGTKTGWYCRPDDRFSGFDMIRYDNDTVMEYYEVEDNGRVHAYSPCLRPARSLLQLHKVMRFNQDGHMEKITLGLNHGSPLLDFSFTNGQYKGVQGELSPSLAFSGIHEGERLHGSIYIDYFEERLALNFESGRLVGWDHYSMDAVMPEIHYTLPPGGVVMNRPDLSQFCLEGRP